MTNKTLFIDLDMSVKAAGDKLYKAFSTAEGFESWWAESCALDAATGKVRMQFGPEHTFEGTIVEALPNARLTIRWEQALEAWIGTQTTFEVKPVDTQCFVRLTHSGWKMNGHEFRSTAFHWPGVLKHLKAYVEKGELVPFAKR